MNNYNVRLENLREAKQLSLKDAAKQIGIPRFSLYLYENGYFRPTKRHLKKIEDFYQEKISFAGEDSYPAPLKHKAITIKKEPLKAKRIIFGALAAAFLTMTISGAVLFNNSVNNTQSYYGEVYNETKQKVQENGNIGHDLVTSLPYRYIDEKVENGYTTIIFYDKENILYFNECTYSRTALFPNFGFARFHYHFGSNLGVDSKLCDFHFSSLAHGFYFTCEFIYNGDKTEKVDNLNVTTFTDLTVDEAQATEIVNTTINNMEAGFSKVISNTLGKEVSFYNDFLPAREKGRVINYALQLVGLLLIFPGVIGFFIFFGIFLHSLLKNIKPRLVLSEPEKRNEHEDELPRDYRINIGIPDIFVSIVAKIFQYGSILLLLLAFLSKVGLPWPTFMSNGTFLKILQLGLLTGIFLDHFVVIGRIKKAATLFKTIIYNLFLFLFIATIETVLISITNAWGYDFAGIIYRYVPSNVYQVVALHYLIYLFLFFQPAFFKNDIRRNRIIWHALSLIPLGVLIASYFLSNSYALVYGVKENIFVNFWFPNGFLPLSIVCVLFLYITFGVRLYCEKKYGQHKAQYFFYGDRYGIVENTICASLILIVGLLDLLFMNNQYAYYLGLGDNEWVFLIIPFILFIKYSPNSQQIFIMSDEDVKE